MREGEVKSLSVYSEKGGHLSILHPQTGKVVERETKAGETVVII